MWIKIFLCLAIVCVNYPLTHGKFVITFNNETSETKSIVFVRLDDSKTVTLIAGEIKPGGKMFPGDLYSYGKYIIIWYAGGVTNLKEIKRIEFTVHPGVKEVYVSFEKILKLPPSPGEAIYAWKIPQNNPIMIHFKMGFCLLK